MLLKNVFFLNINKFQVTSFTAYNVAVTHCCSFASRQSSNNVTNSTNTKFFIVSVGTDSESLEPSLKIWRINELNFTVSNSDSLTVSEDTNLIQNFSDNCPTASCIRSVKLCPSNPQLQFLRLHALVTVLDVFEDSAIAVGFNDGHCLIIKGELIRDRNLKMNLIRISSNESSVTGLSFSRFTHTFNKQLPKNARPINSNSESSKTIKQPMILFVATRNEICSVDLSTRQTDNKLLLGLF